MSTPRPDFRHLCNRCGQAIAWVKTPKGKRVSLDMHHPKVQGKIWLDVRGTELVAFFLGRDAESKPTRPGALTYTCHFDTCPKKPEARFCPVDQCQIQLRGTELLCKTHWERLSKDDRFNIKRCPRGGDAQAALIRRAVEGLNMGAQLRGERS